MLRRIAETIACHRMFTPGQRAGVAVSGGADSVCLLHALVELAPALGIALSVLHLDHGLRGAESREDAYFVEAMAARLGLPFHSAAVKAGTLSGAGNLEQAAREARRAFFRGFLEGGKIHRIATGHTRSDQAETVLFRFLRGAGTAGLAGIRPVTADGIVRPLIEIERTEILAWLRERGILWREDSTNASFAFDRNRIRHQLLPALTRDWNPALISTLANMADWAREEEAWWDAEMTRLAGELLTMKPPAVLVEATALNALRPAVARRLVRHAIHLAKGDLRAIDFEHVRAVLELATTREGSGRVQIPGIDAFRSFDWLRLAPPETPGARDFCIPLRPPSRAMLPSGAVLLAEITESREDTEAFDYVYNGQMGCLDAGRIPGPLEVRNWRPGDRYQPVGSSDEQKVKLLFQQARIPLWERRHWPVVKCGDEILWVRQFGPATAYAATPESRQVLLLRYSDG